MAPYSFMHCVIHVILAGFATNFSKRKFHLQRVSLMKGKENVLSISYGLGKLHLNLLQNHLNTNYTVCKMHLNKR